MFKQAVFTRYSAYIVGVSLATLNVIMLTYYLGFNEFAVWGISMSLVYIFSQLGQLTYVQYVDKYFPNMSTEESKEKIYKFIKTIFIFSPLWLSILFLMEGIGYFDKFLIENIYILFLLITVLVILESNIELISKYMLSLQRTQSFDIYEFTLLKFLRSIVFFSLLFNGYSIYHLFFISIILRSIFLLIVLKHIDKNIKVVFIKIFSSKVFENNFEKIRYTTIAFIIKTLQTTFLNVIFLIYSNFSESKEIATYSLGILIINILRPVIATFSSLLTPKISIRAYNQKKSTNFLYLTSFLNTALSSVFIFVSLTIFIFEKHISEYFIDYEGDVVLIILISILSSTITSIYQPVLLFVKFSDKEKILLYGVLANYFFCLVLYILLHLFNLDNLIIFYMLFEICNLFVSSKIYKGTFGESKVYLISYSYPISMFLVLLYFYSKPNIFLSLFSIFIILYIDYLRFKKNKLSLNL
jgi:hypothetical protein